MSFLCTFIHHFCRTSILLYLTLFIVHFVNADDNCDKVHTAGTGTVLFNPTDAYKICWSQEEIAILTARMILEDILPDPKMISVQCNEDVEDLVNYFKVVIDTVRTNTKARKRHIMLVALTDLLGGFLHHAILPMARKGYYAGAVDYTYMEKLIQLYEELKWFLRTNGQGWTRPMLITRDVKVAIIELESSEHKKENESCCHKVMFYEHEPLKSRKRAVNIEKGIYFPLPFFDAKVKPTAIALPLKHFALRNIESKRAAYAVMKYFIAAENCLKEKSAKPEMIQKFQNNLYTWIVKEVVPKLDDDKFYSAFGGIIRVQNTLKALGATLGTKTCNSDEGEEEIGAVPGIGCSSRRNKLLLIAMLVIIVAWFLIGTCFICYRMKNNRSNKTRDFDDNKGSKGSESASSFTSSKWSSVLTKSSSKTEKQLLCKCCESSISERSTNTTAGFSSTSEYDSEKARRRDRRNGKSFKGSNKKASQSSPCVCPSNEGPAVIDTNHSMKVLPSIAEMSEHSLSKEKNDSYRKITFADDSGMSSSDGGYRVCAPPWAQEKGTVPCPRLSDKSTNYSTSRSNTTKSHGVQDSFSDAPLASSSRIERTTQSNQTNPPRDETMRSNQFSQSYSHDETMRSKQYGQSQPPKEEPIMPTHDTKRSEQMYETKEFDEPLANSTFRHDTTETSNGYGTSNMSNTPKEKSSSQSMSKNASGTMEDLSYDDENKPRIKEEPKVKEEEKDNTYYDYHMSACHSSMAGSYDLYHKTDPTKPYIFGYDFQTTTSSEVSEDDDSKY